MRQSAAAAVLMALLSTSTPFAVDKPLPVLPISLQTAEASDSKKPAPKDKTLKIPEASDTLELPPVALPKRDQSKTPSPRNDAVIPEASQEADLPGFSPPPKNSSATAQLPEASVLTTGDELVSQLAEKARASGAQAKSTTNLASPAAPTTIVEPLQGDVSTGESLLHAASVTVRRTSAIYLDARLRAFNTSQINATANGVNQLKTRIDIDSLFGRIDPALVDAIAVIDGPYSSLYGPGFAFLVADLRAPQRFDSPEGKNSSLLGYETNGSQLLWRQNAYAGGRTWGFLSSFRQRVGNDYSPGGSGFSIPASYNQWDGFASFSVDVGRNGTLDFFYLHNEQNNVELPGVAYDLRQAADQQFNLRYTIWEGDARTERLVLQAWATDTHYRGDNANPSKQATMFGRLIGIPDGPYNNAAIGSLSGLLSNGGLTTYGARGYFKLGDPECWEFTAGADWRLERLFYNETDYDPAGNIAFGGNIFGIPHSSAADGGVFFNLNGKLDPAITLTTGGRLDVWRAGFDAADPVNTTGDPAVYPTKLSSGDSQPTKLLGMAYVNLKKHLTEEVSITGGAAYSMRPPGLAELYSDQPWVPLVRFGNSFSMGDSDLKSEKMIQFDAGVKGEWCKLTAGARAFASRINDYILYRPLPFTADPNTSLQGNGPSNLGRRIGDLAATDNAAISYQYANIGQATLFGGDFTAEFRPRPWCTAFGSIAYVRGVNENPLVVQADGSYTTKGAEGLPGITPLTALVGLRFFEPENDRYGVEINGRFGAKQDYLAESLGELATPGYTVWNLRGWIKLGDHVTINSAVRNLFNQNYTTQSSLAIADPRTGAVLFTPEPGISWVTSVEVSY